MIKVSETRSALRRMALTKVASLIGGQPGWLQQKQNKPQLAWNPVTGFGSWNPGPQLRRMKDGIVGAFKDRSLIEHARGGGLGRPSPFTPRQNKPQLAWNPVTGFGSWNPGPTLKRIGSGIGSMFKRPIDTRMLQMNANGR